MMQAPSVGALQRLCFLLFPPAPSLPGSSSVGKASLRACGVTGRRHVTFPGDLLKLCTGSDLQERRSSLSCSSLAIQSLLVWEATLLTPPCLTCGPSHPTLATAASCHRSSGSPGPTLQFSCPTGTAAFPPLAGQTRVTVPRVQGWHCNPCPASSMNPLFSSPETQRTQHVTHAVRGLRGYRLPGNSELMFSIESYGPSLMWLPRMAGHPTTPPRTRILCHLQCPPEFLLLPIHTLCP